MIARLLRLDVGMFGFLVAKTCSLNYGSVFRTWQKQIPRLLFRPDELLFQGNEGLSVHHSKLRNEWKQTLTGFIIMTVNRPGEIVIHPGEIVIWEIFSAMS